MESERLASRRPHARPEPVRRPPPPGRPRRFGDMTGVARDRARRRRARVRPVPPLHARRSPARRPARPTRPSSAPTSGSSPASPTRSPASARPRPAIDGATASGADRATADDRRALDRHDGLHGAATGAPRGPPARSTTPGGAPRAVDVDGTELTHRPRRRQRPRPRATGGSRATTAGITGRRGTLVYRDLGSTNGSRVNGVAGRRARARGRATGSSSATASSSSRRPGTWR